MTRNLWPTVVDMPLHAWQDTPVALRIRTEAEQRTRAQVAREHGLQLAQEPAAQLVVYTRPCNCGGAHMLPAQLDQDQATMARLVVVWRVVGGCN